MTTKNTIQFELNITSTHDAFILDAKSFAAANDEAKTILADYCDGMTPRQRTSTYKAAKVEMYHAHMSNAHFPENKTLQGAQAVTL